MNIIKKIIEWELRVLAGLVLSRYKPKVIGLTGSVGKTSTKEAIYKVLDPNFKTWKNIKNYNNEIGVPLSILGMESANRNPFMWGWVFFKAIGILIVRNKKYPEMLILEMGADKPGDIKYLVDFAKCHVGVVTAIGAAHLELFGSVEKVAREKQNIVSHLKVGDYAVLNIDDEMVMKMKEKTRAQVITYGFDDEADIRASGLDISAGPSSDPWIDMQIKGISFKLHYKGAIAPVFLPKTLGKHQVYSALAAAAVGVSQGINIVDIAESLRESYPPAGRMRLIAGIKHTSIIDDTYNSSPLASKAALNVLHEIKVSGRKIVAMGDMLELGDYTEQGHRDVGMYVAEAADILVTSGESGKIIAKAAIESGMLVDNVFTFPDPESAGRFIQDKIKKGDIILVKGSQGARMEKVVKELMAEPQKAEELLVRQIKEWQ
ncbi:MAG: UDP-N-acetylmuramoyl-tripeptide--D-alanyl-D-alanine ligase [Candidatus Kerfeldbacteria bacterium]